MELSETQLNFREGMSRLGAAVNLITTDGPAGRHGLTASAVCSITDDPPTLLVCVNQKSFSHNKFIENSVLCVNVLAYEDKELSGHFARHVGGVDRFSFGEWATGETGSPRLKGANASFDCKITGQQKEGTHTVLFCRVVSVTLAERRRGGLVYFCRDFKRIEAQAD
ncbi:flavin reductase [Pseudomonas sp. Z1-14]|uniref:flavin reductase n=1 Tax=Pseudomonas sp. Z1-14 TaxID=2817409 RepID=UPI003DAA19F3